MTDHGFKVGEAHYFKLGDTGIKGKFLVTSVTEKGITIEDIEPRPVPPTGLFTEAKNGPNRGPYASHEPWKKRK